MFSFFLLWVTECDCRQLSQRGGELWPQKVISAIIWLQTETSAAAAAASGVECEKILLPVIWGSAEKDVIGLSCRLLFTWKQKLSALEEKTKQNNNSKNSDKEQPDFYTLLE